MPTELPMPPTGSSAAPVLSRRALNRALLARQGLLSRASVSALDMVRHLAGMQAQEPLAPYAGLWSRIAGFRPEELGDALEARQAVRVSVMRGTIHLLAADDAPSFVPLMRPVLRRGWASSASARRVEGVDVEAVLAAGRDLLEERPRTTAELRDELGRRFPDRDGEALAYAVRTLVPLVQIPPRGVWGKRGQARWGLLEPWLGRPLDPEPLIEDAILRYLGAFGPASVMDIQAWCWLTRLRDAVERLRPRLVTFRDEAGRELFDLPDAPRPDAATPAPVRFIPPYDNIALSHDDRTRVIAPEHRDRLFVRGGALVDGFVAGAWAVRNERRSATLRIEAFRSIEPADEEEVREEAERLLGFLAPEAAVRSIEFGSLPNWYRTRRQPAAEGAA